VAKLEEELSKKNKALAMLEEKLCSQEDYEEIKRELGYFSISLTVQFNKTCK
jgi:homeobox protein cut-like